MSTTLRMVVIMAFFFFLFMGIANGQDFKKNQIRCEASTRVAASTSGYLCEVVHIQEYTDGEALRIASHVAAKTDTDLVVGQDSLFIRYTPEKTYEVWGYGSTVGTSALLATSKSVKDIRLELVVLINGIRLED